MIVSLSIIPNRRECESKAQQMSGQATIRDHLAFWGDFLISSVIKTRPMINEVRTSKTLRTPGHLPVRARSNQMAFYLCKANIHDL